MIIIAATKNENKLREFSKILGLRVMPAYLICNYADPEETGSTFAENAEIKAKAVYEELQKGTAFIPDPEYIIVADDSGLSVDALDGAPGIYSARYASVDGVNSDDVENLNKVLRETKNVPDDKRGAHFTAAICAIDNNGKVYHTEGYVYGKLTREPRGEFGFGYDPIFYVEELGCTTAEVPLAEKNKISHRGKALEELKAKLWS